MNKRVDHAAEAVESLAAAKEWDTVPEAALLVADAQAHATLALVEQQRVANLIAAMTGGDDGASVINGPDNRYQDTAWLAWRSDIREGLGL